MIAISILDEDLHFFDELLEKYPEEITISYDTGADGLSILQIIIDASNSMIPLVISVVGMLLNYKAQKMAEKLNQKELELKEKEMQFREQNKDEIEIRVTSSGETSVLIKSCDLMTNEAMKDNIDIIVNKIRETLENECNWKSQKKHLRI